MRLFYSTTIVYYIIYNANYRVLLIYYFILLISIKNFINTIKFIKIK